MLYLVIIVFILLYLVVNCEVCIMLYFVFFVVDKIFLYDDM